MKENINIGGFYMHFYSPFYDTQFFWLFQGIFSILFMVLLVVLLFAIIKKLFKGEDRHAHSDEAMEILKKRYAKGEISKEEFLQMKKDLKD